ncbi:hypothetical protein B7463_g7345, partial [Scytalidium lignicola]
MSVESPPVIQSEDVPKSPDVRSMRSASSRSSDHAGHRAESPRRNSVDDGEEFSWLKDLDLDGQLLICVASNTETYFIPYDWENTARSTDFGINGVTASLTDWHELLQISAPDPNCGVVRVRGDFPDNPDALLARVQHRDHTGGKGTFGFQMLPDSDLEHGNVWGQGLVNSRWPYMRYTLDKKEQEGVAKDKTDELQDASYETLCFVKNSTMYQVVRIFPGDPRDDPRDDSSTESFILVPEEDAPPEDPPPKQPNIIPEDHSQDQHGVQDISKELNVVVSDESSPKEQQKLDINHKDQIYINVPLTAPTTPSVMSSRTSTRPPRRRRRVAFQVGGLLRFDCPCFGDSDPPTADLYSVHSDSDWIACRSKEYDCTLYIQVFEAGGERLNAIAHPGRREVNDTTAKYEIELEESKAKVVIVAYTLIQSDEEFIKPIPTYPSSSIVSKYLGLKDEDEEATNRIWSVAWHGADEQDAMERRAIVTCVERILCVSSVPNTTLFGRTYASYRVPQRPEPKDDGDVHQHRPGMLQVPDQFKPESPFISLDAEVRSDPITNPATDGTAKLMQVISSDMPRTALTQNQFSQQVDLKSVFWQVRLLVKVYNFLGLLEQKYPLEGSALNQKHESLSTEEKHHLPQNHKAYRSKVKKAIQAICVWIMHVEFNRNRSMVPSASGTSPRVEHDDYDNNNPPDPFDACYQVMAIWYIMHHCQDVFDSEIQKLKDTMKGSDLVDISDTMQNKRDSSLKLSLLQWYRRSCILRIRTYLGLEISHMSNLPDPARRAVRLSGKARTEQLDTYSAEDELEDRLALLATEIFPGTYAREVDIVVREARKRISQRTKTTTFNAGTKKLKSGRVRACSPWELVCLNHHNLLWAGLNQQEEVDVKAIKDDCFEFLASDYTFLPSWDTSKREMLRQWWDYDVSSIVCATLLDLKIKALEPVAQRRRSVVANRFPGQTSQTRYQSPVKNDKRVQSESAEFDRLYEMLETQMMFQKSLLETLQKRDPTELSSKYDWTGVKPGWGENLHPQTWVQSLDDTPEKFREAQLRKVQLRSEVKKYLRRKNGNEEVPIRNWSIGEIYTQIPIKDVLYLSFFDLTLGKASTFYIKSRGGRANPLQIPQEFTGNDNQLMYLFDEAQKVELSERNDSTRNSSLWSCYLENRVKGYPYLDKIHPRAEEILANPKIRQSLLTKFLSDIHTVLDDSMVDQDVRHRLLFVQRCSPKLIEALIYIWHTDALDTIDNYFTPSSQFSNTTGSAWITTITISHWRLEEKHIDKMYDEKRANPLIIPLGEKAIRGEDHNAPSGKIKFEETASSLVITGDKRGMFWTCLFMSSLMEEDSMPAHAQAISEALTLFINQQSSGRCLAFLILLGHLCVQIAKEYDAVIDTLMARLSLGDKVLMMGFDWEERDLAVYKLRRMILCLEALRVFDDRLSSSLSKIKEARETMVREIAKTEQELGKHHEDLDQGYRNILEEFDKRHGNLSIMHLKIQQKIEQISRLRDGISSVTNVEDSRAAIKQNNNIRVLTYITIAYLPLAYVAALFSLSVDILPGNFGSSDYVWMTLCFVVATFAAAFSIEPIQAQWSLYQKNRVVKQESDAINAELSDEEEEQEQKEQREKSKKGKQKKKSGVKVENEKNGNDRERVKERKIEEEKKKWPLWEGLRKREKQKALDEEAEVGARRNDDTNGDPKMSAKKRIPILRFGSSRTDNKDISIVTESVITP